MVGRSIVALCIDHRETDLDRVELVSADPAAEDFGGAGRGVERPRAVLAHDGDGKGPILFAHVQHDYLFAYLLEAMLLCVGANEPLRRPPVGHWVARVQQLLALWSQNGLSRLRVAAAQCICEGLGSFRGRGKSLLLGAGQRVVADSQRGKARRPPSRAQPDVNERS